MCFLVNLSSDPIAVATSSLRFRRVDRIDRRRGGRGNALELLALYLEEAFELAILSIESRRFLGLCTVEDEWWATIDVARRRGVIFVLSSAGGKRLRRGEKKSPPAISISSSVVSISATSVVSISAMTLMTGSLLGTLTGGGTWVLSMRTTRATGIASVRGGVMVASDRGCVCQSGQLRNHTIDYNLL